MHFGKGVYFYRIGQLLRVLERMPVVEQLTISGNFDIISGSQLEGSDKLWIIKTLWREVQECLGT